MKNEKSFVREKDTYYIYAILSFAFVFIIIGIPLWWKTTEVYRVPLPYNQIEELATIKILHIVPVTITVSDTNLNTTELLDKIVVKSNSTFVNNNEKKPSQVHIEYIWKVQRTSDDIDKALHSSFLISDLDQKLSTFSSKPGSVNIIILPVQSSLVNNTAVIGYHRWAYLKDISESSSLEENIINLVKVMVQADVLKSTYTPPSAKVRRNPDKDRMRSLSAAPVIDITFSLIVPEPNLVDIHWDIAAAVEGYVKVYIQKLFAMINMDIKSQVLYMTHLNIQPKFDSKIGVYRLDSDQLPLVINPVEAKLGSHASVNPTLNFVVYIPPQKQTPLHVYDEKGDLLLTNAFLSPRWGGFLIYNVPIPEGSPHPYAHHLDMQKLMEVFLAQLHLLLGLPNIFRISFEGVEFLESYAVTDWQVDFLLRRHSQEYLSTAISSLHSLGQLLGTINNIVIRDDVGEKIYSAVDSVQKSADFLSQGQLLESFQEAKYAFLSSDQAFFDPSLLALLYFPDDQKYAIYIPMFLPVGISVALSIYHLWAYFAGRKNNKEEKLD